MPITPFHFGPGAALHALAPRHVSFLAFCAANVLTDVEPLYYMLSDQFPVHRFLHTYVGATPMVAAVLALFLAARWLALRLRLPNPLDWQGLGLMQVLLGAAAGCYSHVAIDSIMHYDMSPFAPFSNLTPTYGIVSLDTLHIACALAGVAGLLLLGARALLAYLKKR
jgi:membrane-bound metal-dependent hydrolase YbcI (DUF457 family)